MAEALSPAVTDEIDALAHEVLEAACARDLMLATAESCTGGLLASLLTDIPGQSHAFERGFVVYAREAKTELLGVPASLLEDPGPVSEVVARAMAEGALAHSRAYVAAAITGFAGKGETPDDPAGLVHFAVARRGGETLHRREIFGDIGRAAVRIECLRVALELMREQLAPRLP
jgi:nicotinamide-nucleotide amidase